MNRMCIPGKVCLDDKWCKLSEIFPKLSRKTPKKNYDNGVHEIKKILSNSNAETFESHRNEEVCKRNSRAIKRDFRTLGRLLKGLGVQVVFSSVLSVGDGDPHKRGRVDMLNEWFCGWCHTQGFGYYGSGHSLEKRGMLTADGSQLARRVTNILGNKLAGLISWALN